MKNANAPKGPSPKIVTEAAETLRDPKSTKTERSEAADVLNYRKETIKEQKK